MNVLTPDQQAAVVAALCEGCSIRAVERLTGIHRDTIMRLGARVGRKCEFLHDAMMRDLRASQIEIDELWSYIGKKQKRLRPEDDPSKGDCYTFIALDAINKAILSYRTGKRDAETTEHFLTDLRMRVLGTPMISSDAFTPYEEMMRWTFGGEVHYGQIVKRYVGEPPINAARRYSPGTVVAVDRQVISGEMPKRMIGTSHVERQNLCVRMASRLFTRLTNGFSKKTENHAAAVSLYHPGLRETLPRARDDPRHASHGARTNRSSVVDWGVDRRGAARALRRAKRMAGIAHKMHRDIDV